MIVKTEQLSKVFFVCSYGAAICMMVARGETRTVNGRGSRSGMRLWVGEPGMVEQLWGEDDVRNQRGGSGKGGGG